MSALLRTLVVDDSSEIRLVLKLALDLDGRFEVVGEAGDGEQAIAVARDVQPDLVVLDRHMPKLDGLGALPGIREVAPGATVVLFTAYADNETRHAAMSAGAAAVREKVTVDDALLDDLAGLLAAAAAPTWDDELTVSIGPVPIEAARVWLPNTRRILDAVRTNRHLVAVDVPDEDLATFARFIDQWSSVAAEDSAEFFWTGAASAATVRSLVESWARVDAMSDADLEALGIAWSPPEGEPFFLALTTAVLAALASDPGADDLHGALRQQWG